MSEEAEKIVGHKTMADGSHKPLYESEANEIIEAIRVDEARREAAMPTEQAAIAHMFDGWLQLKDKFGWRDAIYCPKDGTIFDAIEIGSTGIHDCSYEGEWPNGRWWVHAEGDMWPSRPVLFRLKSAPLAAGSAT